MLGSPSVAVMMRSAQAFRIGRRSVPAVARYLCLCLLLVSCTGKSDKGIEPTTPLRRAPYAQVDQVNNDKNSMSVIKTTNDTVISVDIEGLSVNASCAHERLLGYNDNFRTRLLEFGCAKITSSNPSQEEVEAQKRARQAHLGVWTQGPWARFLGSLSRNWLTVLSVLLALLGLPWVKRFIDRQRDVKVRVVLVGIPGAGKTDLWKAWRDGMAPRSDAKPSIGVRSDQLEPVPFGKLTFSQTTVDTAGSEPWHLIDEMRNNPGRRRKRVMVIVLAPTAQEAVNGQNPIDSGYIDQQKGFMNLPRAILGGKQMSWYPPDLVVLFVTKFDLLSDHAPRNPKSNEARQSLERQFDDHTRLVSSQCSKHKVPFLRVVGSAKEGWGIDELRDNVRRILAERVK